MAYRAIRLAVLLSCLPLAGCGTVANLANQRPGEGGTTPFGGVGQDLWCMEKAVNGEFVFNAHPEADAHQYHQVALTLFCAVDLPLSFVGDVITWPYTASYTFINSPVPTPPVIQASDSPPPQMTFDGGVKTAPIETLPEPKKLP